MLVRDSLLLRCGLPLKATIEKNYGRRKEIRKQLSSYFAPSSSRTKTTGPGRHAQIITSAVAMSRSAQGESCEHAGCQRQSVAVIGAGAAGLAAAKELLSEGHSVAVFEQGDRLGGVWVYTPETEDEPLGLDPCRAKQVHSSMYCSLRTNLPREIMGFLDFPFLPRLAGDGDPRRYPGHGEVLLYLQDFAEHFNLIPHIRFSSKVTYAGIEKLLLEDRTGCQSVYGDSVQSTLDELKVDLEQNSVHSQVPEKDLEVQWRIVSEGPTGVREEVFDAVAICNGHYFQPKVASIPGINKWPGKQLHSHNYRVPQPFASQVVVVIGNSSSGMDISRDVAAVAHEVHWAARSWDSNIDLRRPVGPLGNIRLHPMVQSAKEDGTVLFEDGQSIAADVILYCTGYEFSFPFLDSKGIVEVDSGRVGPLYQHVFSPLLSPSLSFIGLPFKVVPFPLMQLQAKWIAMVLSRRIQLPTRREMMKVVEEFYASLEVKGLPKYRTHDVGSYQFEYDDWLVKQCGCAPLECWRKDMYVDSSKRKRSDPDGYRDNWTDQDIHEIAVKDLMNLRTTVQYAS